MLFSTKFDSRRGHFSTTSMSTDSEPAFNHRGDSDLGKVFSSGVRIDRNSYGLGVFAFAFIPQGTPIARVSGQVIRDPDYGSDYCIDAGDGKVLEPSVPFCYLNHACEPNCQLTQYVKEKEVDESEDLETGELTEEEMELDEDCELSDDDCIYGGLGEDESIESCDATEEDGAESGELFEDDADAEIWVEAIRDIMPNEELTIDYAWPADRAARCLCGQPQCRGWIVDPAERKLLPK
jgi:hypothetical protein